MELIFTAKHIAARMKGNNKYTIQKLLAFFKGDSHRLSDIEKKEVRRIVEKELNKLIPK